MMQSQSGQMFSVWLKIKDLKTSVVQEQFVVFGFILRPDFCG